MSDLARPNVSEHPRRSGLSLGCLGLLVALAALVAGLVLAFRRPAVGVPLVLAAGAALWVLLRQLKRREVEDEARLTARLRAIAPPEGAAWRALFAAEGLGSLIDRLAPQARAAVRLETSREPTQVGRSHIGGLPDLPADIEWPRRKGKPLTFVAQMDLAEVKGALSPNLLPENGWLVFFHSDDDSTPVESEHGSLVLYLPAKVVLDRRAPPDGLSRLYQECAVRLCAYEDIPEPEGDELGLDDDQSDSFFHVTDYLSSGGTACSHKLLGHAQPIQESVELEWELALNGVQGSVAKDPRLPEWERRSKDWRLLLQLDTDDAASMMWGDAGRVYFGIREEDLRNRLFERTCVVSQCY